MKTMKTMTKWFLTVTLSAMSLAAIAMPYHPATKAQYQDSTQRAGVGLEATVSTGYGLYAITMRANSSPGAISSFYMYEQNGTYPARWHEIDLEMTPGFTSDGNVIDKDHPHLLAKGQCYDANTVDTLPTDKACQLSVFKGTAASHLSFNTYNHRSIDGYPYAHSNDQVFMPSQHGNDIFKYFYTYYIYYTPNGIYWTKDLPEQILTQQAPTQLPQPSFVKKDFHIVAANPTWDTKPLLSLAFKYDQVPLTPRLANGPLAPQGALMKISMNLWDGSNTDPNHQRQWGGPVPPAVGSSSAYKYVAFYPLKTPVAQVGNDPTKLQYATASLYSDFTTPSGTFIANGKATTFNELWKVSNGQYLWPLGQLDARNLQCSNGVLTMSISNPYPEPRQNYQALPCAWLNRG